VFDLTLSFDNGPEPEVTPVVLDELRRRGLRSTFFVIGQKLLDPERWALAARARDEGHRVGNHTFTHSVPLGRQADAQAAEDEIAKTQAALGTLAGDERLFRPYGGGGQLGPNLFRASVLDYLARERFTCVLWNAVPRDWAEPDNWVERALAQCRSQPWTLLVLHDLPTGAMRHLPRFLDAAQDAGARFHQDFPPACVPMRRGEQLLPMEGYVSQL
jgi:peptidoglycan/xylan/chitin deacetylase (PgdA/CDA1 family)